MTRYAIFALAALAACTGDKSTDSGDTAGPTDPNTMCENGMFTGPVVVTYASVACDANDTVRIYAETEGWTSDGEGFMQETANAEPNWSDSITLESFEYDDCGEWDHLEHELQTGAAFEDYQPNVNTLFTCDAHFDPSNSVMSYAVGVYDQDGAPADCLAWGDDPQAMLDGTIERVNEPEWDFTAFNCQIGVPAR